MERETTHDTYKTDVIVLRFRQGATRVHVLKYESDACEVHQKLRRIIDDMNRNLYYPIDNTVPYTFYETVIYTPNDAVDTLYLGALCDAMSRIARDLQTRKDNKWDVDRFSHNTILGEVHRVFFGLGYHRESFLADCADYWT